MTDFLRALLLWFLFWVGPVVALSSVFYFISTLPARRREKMRTFLDLLQTGLDDGRSPEHTIISASQSRDHSLGARFHLIAAWIEEGLRLPDALARVPAFLHPGVAGLLRAGVECGDFGKGLAAARVALGTSLGKTSTALHYGFALICLCTPFAIFFLPFWKIFIWPKFLQIYADMSLGAPLPKLTQVVTDFSSFFLGGYLTIVLLLFAGMVFYMAAPKIFRSESSYVGLLADRFACLFAWKWKRVQRDFSLSLGMLLEKNVPEAQALALAGQATGNRHIQRKAAVVAERVAEGMPLPEAIKVFDSTGQFEWRLANALHSRGFLPALAGWHEALESEAWRAEESLAHILSVLMLLLNGLFVGAIVSSVFLLLVSLIQEEALW